VNLTQVAKITRREYIARVRTKAFVIVTILVPAFLGLYMFAIPRLARSGTAEIRLAIVDAGAGMGQRLAERLEAFERPRIVVTEVTKADGSGETSRERFSAAVRAGALDAYLVVDPGAGTGTRARYFAREVGSPTFRRELTLAVQSAVIGRLLAGTGVDVEEVGRAQELTLEAVTISADGEREGGFEQALVSTIVMAMLLYMAVLINGQGMATAIVEEKSSRLIEVILGAVTASEFMTGKILGVLGAGLTQLGIWLAVSLVVLLQGLPALMMGSAATGFDLGSVLNARLLFYFAIFFSLGYLLYSVLFALVAVTCTSTEELAQSMMVAVLPMVVAMIVAISVITNPSTPQTRVLSLIPFFTPLVMLARVNVLMPPLWEVWLGIGLLLAASVATAWISAKVFRYALLMTGKRPSIPELIRVVRKA
jgi:ABC-2 type transport system permease protein